MDGTPSGTPFPEFPPPPPPPGGAFPGYTQPFGTRQWSPEGPPKDLLAGPGSRFGARILDGLILGVPLVVLFFALVWDRFRLEIDRVQYEPNSFNVSRFMGDIFWFLILSLLVSGAYEIAFVALRGQTLGKMAVGIKVVQIEDGQIPSWGRAGLRYVVPAGAGRVPTVGGIAQLLVYLWLLWDPMRQGIHDKVARTVVIRTR